ncbi:UNVERIFIED_CONTAM: protein GIGANTEA [Sesamum angustifolium]|uniref:Protein GIGANTEA n=1 Tax=Sesamum angustifolium TaxID=2727405 RepID=A0AAW2L3M2_9LAMI
METELMVVLAVTTLKQKADSSEVERCTMGKGIASLPIDASDLANFLTMDRHIDVGSHSSDDAYTIAVMREDLSYLMSQRDHWYKLKIPSQKNIHVVAALCNVVSASPAKAATAVFLQAERELKPWIAKDDDLGQKMWRINQRIVKVIVELMRNHEAPESLVILASASDVLLRATDGMLVDGEACTLPQLECRLPATVRCVSHPSAHVRALSTSVLRAILHAGSTKLKGKQVGVNGIHRPPFQYINVGVTDWRAYIEKCLAWEAHSRLATGLPIQFVNTAAKELGCTISI